MDPRHLHHISEGGDTRGSGGDRFPQWCIQETRDFLTIRAELDSTFMETKRNKLLWEVISTKMKERGYDRSVEQCKSKWKNLVSRYKGCETMDQEGIMRQHFPFFSELQAIFTNRMQRLLWMEPSAQNKRGMEFSSNDEGDNNNDSCNAKKASGSSKKRKKVEGRNESSTLNKILENFMIQQKQNEMEFMKIYEVKEEDKRVKEMEWRKTMQELERERLMLDEQWREREDQRRVREEARAEKQDAHITALLNKLTSN